MCIRDRLKEKWIEGKIDMEMTSVDSQIEKLHEEWDEEERKQFAPEYTEKPSEVKGLMDMEIKNPVRWEDLP